MGTIDRVTVDPDLHAQVPDYVWRAPGINPRAIQVWCALWAHASDWTAPTPQSKTAIQTIVDDLGVADSTVRSALRTLTDLGAITVVAVTRNLDGGGPPITVNHYHLHRSAPSAENPAVGAPSAGNPADDDRNRAADDRNRAADDRNPAPPRRKSGAFNIPPTDPLLEAAAADNESEHARDRPNGHPASPDPPLPDAEYWATAWAQLRGLRPTAAVLRTFTAEIAAYIDAGGAPSMRLLETAHRRGIRTPAGWQFVEPAAAAPAEPYVEPAADALGAHCARVGHRWPVDETGVPFGFCTRCHAEVEEAVEERRHVG